MQDNSPSVRKAIPLNHESSTRPLARPLRVVIAGGGTGGHISPAVAVAEELRRRMNVDLHWIGSDSGFEGAAAAEHSILFYTVRTGKLRRYFASATFIDTLKIPVGIWEARTLLRRIKPDVIFSTGSFVSVPTVVAGRFSGIPCLTHEQTASLGLATRINARFCDVVALSFPGPGKVFTRKGTEVIITGNPIRSSIRQGDRKTLLRLFDIPPELPLVYVTGGAQGAHAINTTVADALSELLKHVAIIHQCGPQSSNGDHARLVRLRDRLEPEQRVRYHPVERVSDELAHIYASAALVVGRSGAGTVAELAALGVPSILVPLPGAEEQLRNAHVLADAGASIIIPQGKFTPETLTATVQCLVNSSERLQKMREAALGVAPDDPTNRLCDAIVALADRH